jgi:Flp pilus assembly protein TadD
MTRFLLASMSLLLGLFGVFSTVHASPQDQYLQIYLLIQEAERLESSGQKASARERYDVSLNRLQKLQQQYPEWEPVIVKYRINFCREKVDKLKDGVDANPDQVVAPIPPEVTAAPQPAPVAPTRPSPAPSPTPTAVADNEDTAALKQRIKDLESELADTKKKLADAMAEASELRARQADLEKEIAALRSAGSDSKINELLDENRQLKTQLAEAQNQIKNVQTGSGETGGDVANLQEQLKKVQDQLALSTKQNEALQQTNAEFRQKLEEAQNKLTESEAKINELSKPSPLVQENKILRSIIDRQLKEQARREAAKRLALEELTALKIESAALKTQIDILGSPYLELTEEERQLLRAPTTDLVVEGGSISAKLDTPTTTTGDLSSRPRVPEDFRDVAQEATELFAARKFDAAAAKYQMILNAHPDSLYALSNIGVVRFQQQNYPEAEKNLRAAVQLAPQDAFSHSILGIVLYQQGKFDEAVQILTRAVALDPNDPKTRNYLGISASQKGWQEAAETECRKAIELDPNYGDAHFNLAVIYATQKPAAKELAKRHYKRAMELGVPRDEQLEKLIQ